MLTQNQKRLIAVQYPFWFELLRTYEYNNHTSGLFIFALFYTYFLRHHSELQRLAVLGSTEEHS